MDDDVLRTVHNVSDAISSVESALKPLFGTNWDAQVGRLDPIDASRFHLTVAYAVNALFFIYIKACGLDEDEYKVNADLKRIQTYMKKLQALVDEQNKPAPTTALNKSAANRFILHAVEDLTVDQKRKLKNLIKQNEVSIKKADPDTSSSSPSSSEGTDKEATNQAAAVHLLEELFGEDDETESKGSSSKETGETPPQSRASSKRKETKQPKSNAKRKR
mmetsp:Transcript_10052/g.16500  ORF Transcript_10052/g.16500 Transcript_10052/m.16500 type:complete len:219 (+) Transcript_10052:40-696(+)